MATKYKFTQIPEQLYYPSQVKAQISSAHSNLIMYASTIFNRSASQRRQIIHAMNVISYMYMSGDSTSEWDPKHPMDNLPNISDEALMDCIGKTYINEKNVTFDIDPVERVEAAAVDTKPSIPIRASDKRTTSSVKSKRVSSDVSAVVPTNKSDLYIQPPTVPRFNTKEIYAGGYKNGSAYCVYMSEPRIPTKQNEISATTDISLMIDSDFMRLYPNTFIRTRSNVMYEPCDGIKMHPKLGLILPVEGFTEEQIVDNIVKYPHLFKLTKMCDDKVVSFYTTIEIDGELQQVSQIWGALPESNVIPYSSDFIKEYVVRRYLLERDVKHMDHRYSMYGTLDPFLTLFTTPEDYAQLGYTDSVDIAKQCVASRVSYKRSRNPVLRRLEES